MNYEKAIWQVLLEAGSAGISVQKLARHVFNACNSLFCPISYDDVHAFVSQFLLRHSKDPESMIMRTETRGIYSLNPENQESRQLMLQFVESTHPAEEHRQPQEDLSLSLFSNEII